MPFSQKRNRRSVRIQEYDYSQPGEYFVTICTYQMRCLFGELKNGRIQLNRFGQIVEEEWLRTPCLRPDVKHGVRKTMEVPRVIVSSGDYGNPPLLYRSGYGPRELTGGNLVVENRNVGRNTDNRPQAMGPIGIFDEPITDGEFKHNNAFYCYEDLYPDKSLNRLSIAIWPVGMGYPDRLALGAQAPQFGREHKEYMRDIWDVAKMTPARREIAKQARSRVEVVRPANHRGWINEWGEQLFPGHDPAIVKPLEQAREVVYEMLKKMGVREILGMDRPVRVYHLEAFVGSCIVGTDPQRSVVNPYFESHDIDGLFICDASVVPRAASQGYAGTVATVALFGADRIVERHFKRG